MAAARDDHDVCDACVACVEEGLEGIVDHGFIIHGQQVLVFDFCDGVEPGTCAACEDYTFHVFNTPSDVKWIFQYSLDFSAISMPLVNLS